MCLIRNPLDTPTLEEMEIARRFPMVTTTKIVLNPDDSGDLYEIDPEDPGYIVRKPTPQETLASIESRLAKIEDRLDLPREGERG